MLKRITFFALIALSLSAFALRQAPAEDPAQAERNYKTYCAGCHGEQMQAFVDRKWQYGNSREDLFKSIKLGNADDGMPAFDTAFSDQEIMDLADYILVGIQDRARYDFAEKFSDSEVFQSGKLRYRLEKVVTGLKVPWGIAFLPGGDLLVTDRGGELYRQSPGKPLQKISGVPDVVARGQGGLLDVAVHPNFAKNRYIYLSYSKPKPDSANLATTAVLRARLDGDKLSKPEEVFEALPYASTRHHYGSRIVFDKDGYMYISVGDRGNHDRFPQNLDNHCGKIHRLHDDGRIPKDNPFVKTPGAMGSIYSYGHRNPQGVAINPADGSLWLNEHGPRGGDELNISQKGLNFGWPTISYGINYNGTTFTNKTEAPGMEQPEFYWTPSIGPSGLAFVSGNRYPGWEGSILTGSLRFKYLSRCRVVEGKVVEEELLLKNIGRLRDVRMGPDGLIYVSVEDPGIVYRLVPLAN